MREHIQIYRKRIWKLLKSRAIRSVVILALILYFVLALYSRDTLEMMIFYSSGTMLLVMVSSIFLVLYVAGMNRDFFHGFCLAFSSRHTGISRMELQKSVKAFECAERATIVVGFFYVVLGILDMLSGHFPREMYWEFLIVPLEMLTVEILHPTVILLILTPVKERLSGMVISYMEEVGDAEKEREEAEGQRLYFNLRAIGLTDREAEVARLAGAGLSNAEIGRQLFISVPTVKKHMTHILEKTGCTDREALREKLKSFF